MRYYLTTALNTSLFSIKCCILFSRFYMTCCWFRMIFVKIYSSHSNVKHFGYFTNENFVLIIPYAFLFTLLSSYNLISFSLYMPVYNGLNNMQFLELVSVDLF